MTICDQYLRICSTWAQSGSEFLESVGNCFAYKICVECSHLRAGQSCHQVPYYAWQIVLRHRAASIMNLIIHNHGLTRDRINETSLIENINITSVYVLLARIVWSKYTVGNIYTSSCSLSRSRNTELIHLYFELMVCSWNILECFRSGYSDL